ELPERYAKAYANTGLSTEDIYEEILCDYRAGFDALYDHDRKRGKQLQKAINLSIKRNAGARQTSETETRSGQSMSREMSGDKGSDNNELRSRIDAAVKMLDNGAASSEVYNKTGIAVQMTGALRDGIDGEIEGRYERGRNDQRSVYESGNGAGIRADSERSRGGLGDDIGRTSQRKTREWNDLSERIRKDIQKAISRHMNNADEEGQMLIKGLGLTNFSNTFYSMIQQSRLIAEQWAGFIPDIDGLMDEI
ncbi:MAG: hypothetical protein K5855_09880, partial [Oscillospiraceae bacterium]|nr:hypothetical protein [Oscillospiraceae bacterium]